MTKKDKLKLIQEKTEKILELLGSAAEVKVEEKDGVCLVNISSKDETGLLIGRRGETLSSIQTILAISLREVLEDIHISVDIGDWKEKQEEKLKSLALQAAERVVETKEPQPVYNLNPSQRRIVHMELAKRDDVVTESVGEGEDRYLLVKPKSSK